MLVQIINYEAVKETFRMIFIMIASAIVISAILSILCNWATSEVEKERARKREEIQKSIMPNWSLENAMKVNRETCYHNPDNIRLIKGLYRTPEEDFLTTALENCQKFNEDFEGTFDKG